MASKQKYVCFGCRKMLDRDEVFVKQVRFHQYIPDSRQRKAVRSRTVAWLCMDCLLAEPDYQADAKTPSEQFRDGDINPVTKPAESEVVPSFPEMDGFLDG